MYHEFCYFYIESNIVHMVVNSYELPEEDNLECCTVNEAIAFAQFLGCWNKPQHIVTTNYHRLCLTALRWAVQNDPGETFPVVYRGVRSDRPDSEYKILFGSPDPKVAQFYGKVREYHNVRGLRANSYAAKSVVTGDYSQVDYEIIFFPDLL